MKVSEDRFPLLFVYLEDQEEQYDVRARTITKGAAEILGRWPHYLTFVSYMSMIGLLSLLVCFILSVLVLSLLAPEVHNPRRFPLVRCDTGEEMNQAFRLSNFDNLFETENATFIVDVPSEDDRAVACAVESYLTWTSRPVYHVRLLRSDVADNSTAFAEFEKKFKNYKPMTVEVDSFLSGTTFAGSKIRSELALRFVSKVLISWNFGGTVIDSRLITLSNFRGLIENATVVGLTGSEVVLLNTRRVCHSFVFSLMKELTKDRNFTSQAELVESAYRGFCGRGRNCTSLQVLSNPYFCEADRDGCVFMKPRANATAVSGVWDKVCPLAKFLS